VDSHFTTYLTYAERASGHPLRFAWVVPVSAPVRFRPGTRPPSQAVEPISRSETSSLTGLVTSLADDKGAVPVTVAASPRTLEQLHAAGTAGSAAVTELASMSTTEQSSRQFLPEGYVPFDLGALADAGESTEIKAQMNEGPSLLSKLGIQVPSGGITWVATGSVGAGLGSGMSMIGATKVVVPDATLAPPGGSAGSGTWASSFQLDLGRGTTVTAATSDGELAAHFTSDGQDPALEANQMLADLAMIHLEAPNTTTARGVVAVPPPGWTPDSRFDDELLAGLDGNPDVQATTLSAFFAAFPPAATLPSRRPAAGGGQGISPALAQAITTARLRLTGFDTATTVPGKPPPAAQAQLDQVLLASESDGLRPVGQSRGVAAFERSLGQQLSQVSLATERAITLTTRNGALPITVLSTAPYPVVGTLTLTSDRFEFPQGSTEHLDIDHSTNPVRVDVEARTSGDLPVEVTVESPTGRLVIARGQLTVRSTATSAVGVFLTIAAVVVLLTWWARTWWAGRRRHRTAKRRAASA
jgi:hypothetical protein